MSESAEAPVAAPPIIGGGIPHQYRGPRRRTEEEVRREREELGILQIIDSVALRQAETLQRDEQKRLEELTRELSLAKIEWEGRYLRLLNERREAFISAEIGRLLRLKLLREQEDTLIVLMLAASA